MLRLLRTVHGGVLRAAVAVGSERALLGQDTRGRILGAVKGGELGEPGLPRLLPRRRAERHQRRRGAGFAREGPIHRRRCSSVVS
uniref:Uncharacterized protein n=1 Tax=Arundo donax TaxID=35708 RepID=A0A0A9RNY1_ARUDO